MRDVFGTPNPAAGNVQQTPEQNQGNSKAPTYVAPSAWAVVAHQAEHIIPKAPISRHTKISTTIPRISSATVTPPNVYVIANSGNDKNTNDSTGVIRLRYFCRTIWRGVSGLSSNSTSVSR